MEARKTVGIIFICAYCGGKSTRLPTSGMYEGTSRLAFHIKLCTACGPVNLELLMLCGEATMKSYLN